MKKNEAQKSEEFFQGHTARKQQSWDFNPGTLAPRIINCPFGLLCLTYFMN